MNKPLIALSLSLLAVFGWSLPIAHAAAPAASAAAAEPVALTVSVDELPEDERGVGPVLLEQLRSLVEAGGYEISEDAGAATVLRVRLRILEAGDRNYGMHFEFVDSGVVTPAVEWTDCVFCTEARMLQKLDAKKKELLAAIEARRKAPAVVDDGGEDDGSDADDDSGDGDDGGDGGSEPLPKPIGPIGITGAAVSVVGLGAIAWGAVEVARGEVYEPSAGYFQDRTGTNHAPRGYALVGIGAAVTAAGLVLLGVDLARRAKQRKHARSQALVLPLVSPTGFGLGVTGSF
jgi:hypothetical protein